jgi:hypothetical protein
MVNAFTKTRAAVEERLLERFQSLTITQDGIDWDAVGLRGPSSTWTYLAHEDLSADPVASMLIGRRHVGFAVGAAMTGPLLLLWALRARFKRRRQQKG